MPASTKRIALFVSASVCGSAALAGTACSSDRTLFPIRGGSGVLPGGSVANGLDARPIIDDANPNAPVADAALNGDGMPITIANGRVCVLTDLRYWDICASSGVGNVSVTIGTTIVTTSDDGSFTIPIVTTSGLYAIAQGTSIATSAALVNANSTQIVLPAVSSATWASLQSHNSLIIPSGSGTIAIQLFRDGTPNTGDTVTSDPPSDSSTIYDNTDPVTWSSSETGSAGVAIMAGIEQGTGSTLGANVDVVTGIDDIAFGPINVYDQTITFIVGILPAT